MFRLSVLGTIDLEGPDGRRVGSILNQPKRLALLALLAVESPRRLQRDEVVGLLWPERSDERARAALRQALHYLRRSLGPDVVAGAGSEGIGIDPSRLWCDAAELLRAAGEGRHGDALNLHGGDLLPGFHLDDAPAEYERWLDGARDRVRQAAAESAWAVAESEEASGNAVAAGAAARRAWELGSWSEPALRRLLRLLIRSGDLSGARAAYDAFAARQREHGGEPGPETRSILDEATRWEAASPASAPTAVAAEEGDPAAAEAEREATLAAEAAAEAALAAAGPPGGETASGTSTPAGPPSGPWEQRIGRAWWAVAALALLVLVTWGASPWWPSGAEADAVEGLRVVYLEPVRGGAGAADDELAAVLTNELAAALVETNGFTVVATAGAGSAEGPGIVVRPTVHADSGALRLVALLLDAGSGAVLERVAVVDSGAASPAGLAARLAVEIRQDVGELLTWRGLAEDGVDPGTLAALRSAADELAAAEALVDRGAREPAELAYRAGDSILAELQAANPEWAEPPLRRAELALSATWIHILSPEDEMAEAHDRLLSALDHAEAGVALAPDDPRALEVRGMVRYWAGQTAPPTGERPRGLQARAEGDLERAVRLDPDRPDAWRLLSVLAERRGDYALAYHRARQAYATDHGLKAPLDVLVRLFTNALEVGDAEGAAGWCAKARERSPGHWVGPYCDLARLAWTGPWTPASSRALTDEAESLLAASPVAHPVRARFELLHAVVLARAGEAERAREILATADAGDRTSLELLELRSWVHVALDEPVEAERLLRQAWSLHEDRAVRVLRSRRYEGLPTFSIMRGED